MTRSKVLAISTTTHDAALSTSVALAEAALVRIKEKRPEVTIKAINANDLHIVKNLSCYANGKKDCANPSSGPYRCWATYESLKDPAKYGGADQMPVIYDALAWADTVIWITSTRWGSHSAVMQNIIERMDTLENRGASWGERYPLQGKKCGVIVAGLNWKSGVVAAHLQDVFRWFKFTVPQSNGALVWQRTNDVHFEQPGSNKPFCEAWLRSPEGLAAVDLFSSEMLGM